MKTKSKYSDKNAIKNETENKNMQLKSFLIKYESVLLESHGKR